MLKRLYIMLFAALVCGCFCSLEASAQRTIVRKPTAKPRQDNRKTAKTQYSAADGVIAGHGWVDLGLPSGIKWATCNLGASSPTGYGDYFAWGEASPKSSYTRDNSQTYGKDHTWLVDNGYIDGNSNLTMSHDAARQMWGATWRIPTKEEVEELIDNTTGTWTTQNGVKGCLITSKTNGKSIFLPASGGNCGGKFDVGEEGSYWNSTDLNKDAAFASAMGVVPWGTDCGWGYLRDYGCSIRAVSP